MLPAIARLSATSTQLERGVHRTLTILDECRYVLEMLGQVYGVDAEARERGFTPQQRLELHRQRSAPVMEELHAWLERQFTERRTEPNSGLGKAITYLLRHWRPRSAPKATSMYFCPSRSPSARSTAATQRAGRGRCSLAPVR